MRSIPSPQSSSSTSTAHVVADPFDLSRRAAAIESKLSGDDRLALTVSPTALAEKLKAVPGVADVELWDFPFRTIRDQLRAPNTTASRSAADGDRVSAIRLAADVVEGPRAPFPRPREGRRRFAHCRSRRGRQRSPRSDRPLHQPEVRPPDACSNAIASEPKQKIYSDRQRCGQLLGRTVAVRRRSVRLGRRLVQRSAAGRRGRRHLGQRHAIQPRPHLRSAGQERRGDQALRSGHLAAARRQSPPRPPAQEQAAAAARRTCRHAPAADASNN